jgi:SAM-dependent methyltransferase
MVVIQKDSHKLAATSIKHGNFDSLAGDCAQYRPGYAPSIVPALLALLGRPACEVDAADVGAGTGIWTRMLAAQYLHSVTAVEPSDEMRRGGMLTPENKIAWRSVNDLRVQLGPDLFDQFLDFVEHRTAGLAEIKTIYLTRAWAARRT